MYKAVCIAGLETIKDKKTNKVKYFSDTFLNNIRTWVKENKDCDSKILDARDYKDLNDPMLALFNDIKSVQGLDRLIITCHSDWEGLYIISKYRKGEIPDSHRYVEYYTEWEGFNFNPNAEIWLMGCQAGGRFGKKWDMCIAQDIANKTNTTVMAYASRSSQRYIDGGYRQVPDTGGFHTFTKVEES